MEIYIEAFIFQNVIINFCLIRLIYLTTKTKTSFFKMLIASLVGTIPSIIVVIYLNNSLVINIFKIITSCIMLLIAFKQTKKQFVFNMILLFIYTYAFGGIIISISSNTINTPVGIIMTSRFSLELICLVLIVATYIFEFVVKYLKLKIKTNQYIYDLTIYQNNSSITISAYLDTGNLMQVNGNPILVLDLETYLKLTKQSLIEFIMKKSEEIELETITGKNNLKLFRVDKIEIKNGKKLIKLKNQLIAVNYNNTFKNSIYKALLSPLFL